MIIAVLVAAAIAAEYPAYPKPSYPSYPAYPSYKSYDYVSMLNIPWFLTINNKKLVTNFRAVQIRDEIR